MTETTEIKVEKELLKRYLYAELTAEEAKNLENEFFLNDELFFETVDLENELVDKYAKGKLSGEELLRFEQCLEKFSERKQKIANAIALQTYIEDERPPILIAESSTQTFWQKLAAFFTIQSPLLGSAMAGLLVIFTIAGVILFLDNRQKSEELARLQNERGGIEGVWQQRETELKEQLTGSNQRLKDLENQLTERDDDAGDFTRTLIAEREKNQQLERDLTKLRQEINKPVPTPKSSGPTIASIIITPRGNGGGRFTTSVGENTKKLAVNVALPEDVKEGELFSVQLNGEPFKQNIAPNKKSINLTIPIKNLKIGENKLTVTNQKGEKITDYAFNVDKP